MSQTPGLVLAAYGRQFLVELASDQSEVNAVSKGRKADIAVGDQVQVRRLGGDQAVIDQVIDRRNQLHRSTARREKVLAANIDLIALVLAPEPRFSEAIVMRVGMAASVAGIELIIVANKTDSPQFEQIEPRLHCFENLGLPVVRVSVKQQPDQAKAALAHWLRDKTTLLMGESGMGKSTLLNVLVPDAGHRTAEISQALGSGRPIKHGNRVGYIQIHTTR